MKKVSVTVEHSGKNFSAYIEDLPGCTTTGRTVKELETNMREAIAGHIEVSREFGDKVPAVFLGKFELVFKYTVADLLAYYEGIFTKSALERITGINQRLLSNYATKDKTPSPKQSKRIEEGLHNLGEELLAIEL